MRYLGYTFACVLKRIRRCLGDRGYGEVVMVNRRDLQELLADWERLDREYRALYKADMVRRGLA